MSRNLPEPRIYENERLMHDFNEMQIRIKTHLFNLGDDTFKARHPKPTVQEMDQMLHAIMEILKHDSKPIRRRL